MKMDGIFIFIIFLHFLCFNKGRTQHVSPRCGIPGLPFQGNITPYKTEYEINDRIYYNCTEGYNLEGVRHTDCDSYANWNVQVPPLCRQNFAHKSKTFSSASDKNFDSDVAIDGNRKTCTNIKSDVNKDVWWSVDFYKTVSIEKVYIFATSINRRYNMTISIGTIKGNVRTIKQCYAIVLNEQTSGDSLNHLIECKGNGEFLFIKDNRGHHPLRTLNLCEVAVYSKIELICGEPERKPNCLISDVSFQGEQRVEYYPDTGYSISQSVVTRVCKDGKWFPKDAPLCQKIPGYLPDRAGAGGNLGGNSTRTNMIVGVAIGVTAASVSTIIVIIVVVVVMRKYYRRANRQTSTVSDTEGYFLRVNPSSVSSAESPTIQPTYSRPWDDPALHMYEYIYSESLPRRPPQPSTLERQKANDELVNFDKTGYLAHRNSAKRAWTKTNSKERNTRKSLLETETPVSAPKNMTISSNTNTLPQGRTSCYNELEVDAYGYAEPEDSCHV